MGIFFNIFGAAAKNANFSKPVTSLGTAVLYFIPSLPLESGFPCIVGHPTIDFKLLYAKRMRLRMSNGKLWDAFSNDEACIDRR